MGPKMAFILSDFKVEIPYYGIRCQNTKLHSNLILLITLHMAKDDLYASI